MATAGAGADATSRFYEAFHFDDHEASANELADLVLRGDKRATAGLVWTFEAKGRPIPKPRDLSVVTRWDGRPVCVIETTRVDIHPYDEVDATFAAAEGEGDGSLRFWREAHWRFFSRECQRIGRTPEMKMPVVCERFEVVYPAHAGAGAR
ncbi:MAG TPA: ASCH domain-containing protein [Patescibacteria group bacterium]|jgi:uncharacterized protein YhfF|nr:ASCH domain-containing protein [Patescibacteria group bacterium]